MIRISKLADYAVVIIKIMLNKENENLFNSNQLSNLSGIPEPTVSKIMKLLSKNQVVNSIRGVNGGYMLPEDLTSINLKDIIEAIDGKVTITECTNKDYDQSCFIQFQCPTSSMWHKINEDIKNYLAQFTLDKLSKNKLEVN